MTARSCTCTQDDDGDWYLTPGCPQHDIDTWKGEVAWWRWDDYDGYPPDVDGDAIAINDDAGNGTILPADTPVYWRRSSGVLKAGEFVRKDSPGRPEEAKVVAHTSDPTMAIGVVVQDSVLDEDGKQTVLVAIGRGLRPVRYVVPMERIPDREGQ